MEPFLDISEVTTIEDINNLDVERYKSGVINTNGWTQVNTSKSVIGYMDKLERICFLSTNKNSKLLFRSYETDLYYAKIRVKREICKKCRNEAYKRNNNGKWTDKDDCLAGAWFPKIINPIRPLYGDIATVSCPGPVINKWINDYMIPKIYNILINSNELLDEEFDMLCKGNKHHCALKTLQKIKDTGCSGYEEAVSTKLNASVFNRIGITIDDPHYAGREVVLPPPIWCPYGEQQGGV